MLINAQLVSLKFPLRVKHVSKTSQFFLTCLVLEQRRGGFFLSGYMFFLFENLSKIFRMCQRKSYFLSFKFGKHVTGFFVLECVQRLNTIQRGFILLGVCAEQSRRCLVSVIDIRYISEPS